MLSKLHVEVSTAATTARDTHRRARADRREDFIILVELFERSMLN